VRSIPWGPAVIATAAVALLAPAPASAGFERPHRLAPSARGVDIAANSGGDRILVWQAPTDDLMLTRAPHGQPFGPSAPLPGADGFAPLVEMNERGDALVVWHYDDRTSEGTIDEPCCTGLKAMLVRADGTASKPTRMARRGVEYELHDLELSPRGDLAVLFEEWDSGRPLLRLAPPSGRFHPLERLGPPSVDVRAVTFARRRARVLHLRNPFYTRVLRQPIVERERLRAGRWTGGTVLGRPYMWPSTFQVASDSRGGQVLTWYRRSGDEDHVYAGARDPGGRLRVRRLARERLDHEVSLVTPAIDASGYGLAAWSSPERRTIVTALRRPGEGFRPAVRFGTPPPPPLEQPVAAINSSGLAVLGFHPGEHSSAEAMMTAFREPSGLAVDITRLGGSNVHHFGGTGPQAVYDGSGVATLAWTDAYEGLFVTTGRMGGR
jgi:hypothetical protein